MTEQLKEVTEHLSEYRKNSENFLILKSTFESLSSTGVIINNSYEDVIVDKSHPYITIRKCQSQYLNQIKKGTMATRILCDYLFPQYEILGKNFTALEKEYPEKIEVLQNYLLGNYNIEKKDIVKIITNKCKNK